jgi:hypothetical protein
MPTSKKGPTATTLTFSLANAMQRMGVKWMGTSRVQEIPCVNGWLRDSQDVKLMAAMRARRGVNGNVRRETSRAMGVGVVGVMGSGTVCGEGGDK